MLFTGISYVDLLDQEPFPNSYYQIMLLPFLAAVEKLKELFSSTELFELILAAKSGFLANFSPLTKSKQVIS